MKIYSYSVHKETEILAALINAVTERMSWKCKLQIHFSPTDKVIVDTDSALIRFCPWWVSLSIHHSVKFLLTFCDSLCGDTSGHACGVAFTWPYTGSTYHIATPTSKDQPTTDTGNMRREFGAVWTCVWFLRYTNGQTNRQCDKPTDRQTQYSPFRFFKSQITAEVGNANLPSKYSLVYWCDSRPVKTHSYHPQRNHCDWRSCLRAAWYLYNAVGPMYWHAEVLGHGQRVVGPG